MVDVVATDSKGNAIRDLRPEEFEIQEKPGGPQKIAHFRFVERSAAGQQTRDETYSQLPAGARTNRAPRRALGTPPTILLLDALNTETTAQTQARRHMVRLLKTLPEDTPVAVMLLGRNLRLLQAFTRDRELLQRAVDMALNPSTMAERDPRDDSGSRSWAVQELSLGHEPPDTSQTRGAPPNRVIVARAHALLAFEKEVFASQMDHRVAITVEALRTIAAYLAGYEGRKNLIWFSGSFPLSIAPDASLGRRASHSTRSYLDSISAAAHALTDAQVAVYPVDARGLQTYESFSVSEQNRPGIVVGGLSSSVRREGETRYQTQSTVEELAEDTGGRICRNNNDLSGCVEAAVKDGSSYYELAYYPQNDKWDSEFRGIEVKTTRRGVRLAYRRGYYAVDKQPADHKQASDALKQVACLDYLPATSVALVVQPLPTEQQTQSRYQLTIPPEALTLLAEAPSELSFMIAVCQFSGTGEPLHYAEKTISEKVTEKSYERFRREGLSQLISLEPRPQTQRARFAVLDAKTGLTGSVDIPIEPDPKAAAPATSGPSATSAAVPPVPSRALAHAVTLRGPQGRTGVLDWSGDRVLFSGDLPLEQAALEFFNGLWASDFQCREGQLAPATESGRKSGAQPQPRVNLRNPAGRIATVDMQGKQPAYSGDLPADASAQAFFAAVWRLYQCK